MSDHPPHPHPPVPDAFDDAGDGPLDPLQDPRLEAVLRALTTELCHPPDDLTQRRHLAAMRDAHRDVHRGRLLRRTRRAGAVATLALLAMAVSGVLPGPLQQTVADAATVVGITLPSPQPQVPASDGDRGEQDPGDDVPPGEPAPDTRTQDEAGTPASPAPRPSPRPDGGTARSPAPEESEEPEVEDLDEHLRTPQEHLPPTPPPLHEDPGVEAPEPDTPDVEASAQASEAPSGEARAAGSGTPSSGGGAAPRAQAADHERQDAGRSGAPRSPSRAEAGQEPRPRHPGH